MINIDNRGNVMELWDVLDEHGNKTGKIVDRGTELGQGEYRLVIDVWLTTPHS